MKYLYKLHEYETTERSNCNKKLLREFLAFLEENEYGLEESAEHMYDFTETAWFHERAKTTQRNYRRDLKRFVEWLYSSENKALYPRFTEQEYKKTWNGQEKLEEIQRRMQKKEAEQEAEDTVERDAEYDAFLKRYEEIGGKE